MSAGKPRTDKAWGITEEQAAEGQVQPLCLAGIERSRPWLIGLRGASR